MFKLCCKINHWVLEKNYCHDIFSFRNNYKHRNLQHVSQTWHNQHFNFPDTFLQHRLRAEKIKCNSITWVCYYREFKYIYKGIYTIYVPTVWNNAWFWVVFYTEAATRGVLWNKVFLEISQNSQENTCARVPFFNKAAVLRPATFLKKRLWHRYFHVNLQNL